MIMIFNQHRRLAQLNERGNFYDVLKNRQCLTTGDHRWKKLYVRALTSELSWRQIIARIFHVRDSVSPSKLSESKELQQCCHLHLSSLSKHHWRKSVYENWEQRLPCKSIASEANLSWRFPAASKFSLH